jgi:hypothetical protein
VTFQGLAFFGKPPVKRHRIGAYVESHIAHVQEVIGKKLLVHIAHIAAADHKLIDAEAAVDLQDVPQNCPATDCRHRLRNLRKTRYNFVDYKTVTGTDGRTLQLGFTDDE